MTLALTSVFAAPYPTAIAQAAPGRTTRDTVPFRCVYYDPTRNHLGRQALQGGYSVTVARVANQVEEACTLTVRDRAGRAVLRESGFSGGINVASGMDVDGDGWPELIMDLDSGGGNHCCWAFIVVSFRPTPHRLFTFQIEGASEFRRDVDGRVTLWSWEGGLGGTDGSMAGRLFAQKVLRYSLGKLVDVTPLHCDAILADTTRYQTPPPDTADLRRINQFGATADSAYGIAGRIEELMLQQVFCQRFDRALEMAHAWWPAATRDAFIARYRELVVRAYPQYAEALGRWK